MKKFFCFICSALLIAGLTSCVSNSLAEDSSSQNNYEVPEQYSNPVEAEEIVIEDIENAFSFSIYRRNISDGILSYDDENFINNAYMESYGNSYKNMKGAPVVDYFVNPGDTYQYVIRYFTLGEEIVKETNIKIKQKNGVGELSFINIPKATYNKETGIMKFSELPKFSKEVVDLVKEKGGSYWSNFIYIYLDDNKNRSEICGRIPKYTDYIDWTTLVNDDELYNKDFYLDYIWSKLDINDLHFSYDIPSPSSAYFDGNGVLLENIPKVINVPDKGTKLLGSSTDKGIEIKLPPVPKDANRFVISREQVNKPFGYNRGQITGYIFSKDLTLDSVVDYFVIKGEEYKYVVNYYSDNIPGSSGTVWLCETKPLQIKATGGVGDLISNKDPIMVFDEETEILKFTQVPKLSKQLIDFVNKNGKFIIWPSIIYTDFNNEIKIPITENTPNEIDCKKAISIKNYEGKMSLGDIRSSVIINGVTYEKSLWSIEIGGELLPKTIFVKK